jgi:hypothetical protein
MAASRFKKLFPKVRLVPAKIPRTVEGRVAKLESEVRDLRAVIKELIETLEFELRTDLDRNYAIGRVSRKNSLPKTVRLTPPLPRKPRAAQRPEPLGPSIP